MELEPMPGSIDENQWQSDCQQLIQQINRELTGLDDRVQPSVLSRTEAEAQGKKSAELEIFNLLLIKSGILEAVTKRCWDLIQSFFQRHSGSSGTLVFADGSRITIEGLSTEQALNLIRETREAARQ
jgi:hypothetical protein